MRGEDGTFSTVSILFYSFSLTSSSSYLVKLVTLGKRRVNSRHLDASLKRCHFPGYTSFTRVTLLEGASV